MWDPAAAEKIDKRLVLADQLWRAQTAPEQAYSIALATKMLNEGRTQAEILQALGSVWQPAVDGAHEALAKLA